MKEMRIEEFPYELHQMDNSIMLLKGWLKDWYKKGYIVGYCEDFNCRRVLGLNEQYRVMFEIFDDEELIERYVENREGNRFWFHVNAFTFGRFLLDLRKGEGEQC